MACSDLTVPDFTCDPLPECDTGYTGTISDAAGFTCSAEGDELTLGGCTGPSFQRLAWTESSQLPALVACTARPACALLPPSRSFAVRMPSGGRLHRLVHG